MHTRGYGDNEFTTDKSETWPVAFCGGECADEPGDLRRQRSLMSVAEAMSVEHLWGEL
jgi:hypothetical protein